jgi:hypothetical protein
MPTTWILYPHQVSRLLELRLLDPYDPTQEDLDFTRWFGRLEERDGMQLTIDLSRDDVPQWRVLRVTVEATLPAGEFLTVLPESSNAKEDAVLVLSVQCAATKLRQAVALAPVTEGRWRGDIVLRRGDVRDTLRLRPRLVRRTEIPASGGADGGPIARHRGAVLAEGRDLSLVLDESRKPIGGAIRMQWEDFRQSTNAWRRDHAADLYHLEPYGTEPILWLNSRYEKLRAALYSRATSGADAAVRHLANALLAQTVWVQLIVAAVGSALKDETLESVEPPPDSWKRGVIAKVLPRVFPETADVDRLERALDELRSSDQVGTFMSVVGTAAQEVMASYRLVEAAIRAAERSKGDEG